MTTQTEKKRQIQIKIDGTPAFRLAQRLSNVIAQDYGFADEFDVIFRNRRVTCVAEFVPNWVRPYVIRYGYAFLRDTEKSGSSPKTDYGQFGQTHARGLEAVWRTTLHECAHIVTYWTAKENGTMRWTEFGHNGDWAHVLAELRAMYPFEDAKQYAFPWTDPDNDTEKSE
jgi:hypothetical protein